MNNDFRVTSREVLLHAFSFDVERRLITDGRETFEREVAIHEAAVAILALNDRDEVGLIRQYRAAFDSVHWELPAGRCDVEGESLLETAQRELLEEMGCRAEQWKLLGRFMVSPGWTDHVMTVFEARTLTMVDRRPMGPEEEASSVHWLSADDIRQLVFRDDLVDSTLTMAMNRVFGTLFDSQ